MTNDEWIAAGRPHWQCKQCKGILVTVPIADDFICSLCAYGTDSCQHYCHQEPDYKHPRHCTACDGSRVTRIAVEEDFTEWLSGNRYNNGRYLLDYCVCLQYPRNCRFHNGGKTVTDGPHNLRPMIAVPVFASKEEKTMAQVPYLNLTEVGVGASMQAVIIMGEDSRELARISFDGNVEIFGDVNEAALRFWTAVCQISGGILTHKTK